MKKNTKKYLLSVSAGLLLIALIWTSILNDKSEGVRIANEVNRHGYSLSPSDLYARGTYKNTSIRALLPDEDLTKAISLSSALGYPADVERIGTVALVLAQLSDHDVVVLYFLDAELQLAFIERGGEILGLV